MPEEAAEAVYDWEVPEAADGGGREMTQNSIRTLIAVMVAASITISILFLIPTGEGRIYDNTFLVQHRITPDGLYHATGLIDSRYCGNGMERFFGMRGYDFIISKELFYDSMSSKIYAFDYNCHGGKIEDVVWHL